MIKKIKNYILEEPWEETIRRQERWVARWVICPFLVLAVVYFAVVASCTLLKT